jgi:hypothetical protein
MPTLLLRTLGYIFSFYCNENNELAHVHVEKGSAEAKVWLEPEIKPEYFAGFNPKEKKKIMEIGSENAENFKNKWNEYFKK